MPSSFCHCAHSFLYFYFLQCKFRIEKRKQIQIALCSSPSSLRHAAKKGYKQSKRIALNRSRNKLKRTKSNRIGIEMETETELLRVVVSGCASSDTWLGIKLRHWHGLNNVQWVHQLVCVFNVNSGWVIEDWLTNSKNNKQQQQNESNKMVMTTF